MGVTFFFIIIFISYLIGRKVNINKHKKEKNLRIDLINKKEKNSSDVISPDASWLD